MGHGTIDKGLLVFQMPRTVSWFVMAYQLVRSRCYIYLKLSKYSLERDGKRICKIAARCLDWSWLLNKVLNGVVCVDILVTDCHVECAAHAALCSACISHIVHSCQQGTIHHLDPQNSRSSPGSRTSGNSHLQWISLNICYPLLSPIVKVQVDHFCRSNMRIWG